MTAIHERLEDPEQAADIMAVQPGRGLVEQEQSARLRGARVGPE
jgi:hypothetical protein